MVSRAICLSIIVAVVSASVGPSYAAAWMYKTVDAGPNGLIMRDRPSKLAHIVAVLNSTVDDIQIDICRNGWCRIIWAHEMVVRGWVPQANLTRSKWCTDCGSE
jgi:SH3-like domain-containing protein